MAGSGNSENGIMRGAMSRDEIGNGTRFCDPFSNRGPPVTVGRRKREMT
jgi:hypothetical protein